MKRLSVSLFAIALVLSAATSAWAGPVTWTYDFTPGTNFVSADSGPNQVNFTNQGVLTAIGSTSVVATNLSLATSDAGTWTSRAYSMQVTVGDGGLTHSETFHGELSGAVTAGSSGTSNFTNVFTDSTTRSFVLNGDSFELTIDNFVGPPAFASNTKGAIGAHMVVNGGQGEPPPPPPPTNDVPEPSTLLLTCLGLVGAGFKAWRKLA